MLEGWKDDVGRIWDAELALEHMRVQAAGVADEPRMWPGYQLKRARLFHVAGRVRELLVGLPPDAAVLTEEPLSAASGLLYGRADLIVRSSSQHQIIDYKSGGVLDRDTKRPREAYVRQLQLYAYLEHETSGSWPLSAHLFPLHGVPVEIDVDPEICSALAREALAILGEYNQAVPAVQPADPSPMHCKWCPFAAVCGSFWDACDSTWAPDLLAAAGMTTRQFTTPLGGLTVFIDIGAGSVVGDEVVIKNIDTAVFSDARGLVSGDELAAVGLVADDRGSGYWISGAGVLGVTRQGKA
jgi:CRISPR/Cas system-associated exonuclease Cas4 (RecB family)